MNKKEYAEFHKLLAMLYYDYVDINNHVNLSEECRKANNEIIKAIQKLMKVIVIQGRK